VALLYFECTRIEEVTMTVRELVHWEPLTEIVDRAFGDTSVSPWHLQEIWGRGYYFFPVDILETKDEVIVKARLPGMSVADLDISLEGDLLSIKGEYKAEEGKDFSYFRREMHYGSFCRQFTLPTSVKADKVVANLDNGILTIKLPKEETAKTRTIKVVAKPLIEASKK